MKCRQLCEQNAPGTKELQGKRLLAILAAKSVTSNNDDRRKMIRLAKDYQIEFWLPNGSGLSTGDRCFKSPYAHFRSQQPLAPSWRDWLLSSS